MSMSLSDELRDRLFLMLEKRFMQIVREKHCDPIKAYVNSIPEWDLLLFQHGIEVTHPKDFRKGATDVLDSGEVLYDPSDDLAFKLGLTGGRSRVRESGPRFLEMSNETAMKILALGLP